MPYPNKKQSTTKSKKSKNQKIKNKNLIINKIAERRDRAS